MAADLRSLSASQLVALGGLRKRCSEPMSCVAHDLHPPCGVCEAEDRHDAVCETCGHKLDLAQASAGAGERDCGSEAVFGATGRVAFEAEALRALGASAATGGPPPMTAPTGKSTAKRPAKPRRAAGRPAKSPAVTAPAASTSPPPAWAPASAVSPAATPAAHPAPAPLAPAMPAPSSAPGARSATSPSAVPLLLVLALGVLLVWGVARRISSDNALLLWGLLDDREARQQVLFRLVPLAVGVAVVVKALAHVADAFGVTSARNRPLVGAALGLTLLSLGAMLMPPSYWLPRDATAPQHVARDLKPGAPVLPLDGSAINPLVRGRYVSPAASRVRAGPGTRFVQVASLPPDADVEVVGQDRATGWYLVELPAGTARKAGSVSRGFVAPGLLVPERSCVQARALAGEEGLWMRHQVTRSASGSDARACEKAERAARSLCPVKDQRGASVRTVIDAMEAGQPACRVSAAYDCPVKDGDARRRCASP